MQRKHTAGLSRVPKAQLNYTKYATHSEAESDPPITTDAQHISHFIHFVCGGGTLQGVGPRGFGANLLNAASSSASINIKQTIET